MRVDDIINYDTLLQYLHLELAAQTQKSAKVYIELPEKWFLKLAKFISFCLKHDPTERWAARELDGDCKEYRVRMNKVLTIIKCK